MNHLGKYQSYIIRNPYSYCFRLKVPIDIQGWVGKKELRYSLKTGYLGIAKQKSRYSAGQVQAIFRVIRKWEFETVNLPEDKIRELINNYIKQSVERINNLFDDRPGDDIPPFGTIAEYDSYISDLDSIRHELIANLNIGNWEVLEDEIIKFLESQGIKDIDKNAVEYQRLCAGIHQAEIKLLPIEKRHRLNDFSYKKELPEVFPEVFDELPEHGEPSEPLDKVVMDYWNEKKTTWKPRSKTDIRRALDHMVSFIGKVTHIHRVDAKVMREYKQFLMSEKTSSGNPRTINTINDKYLCFAKAFFNFAKSNQYIQENPAQGILIKDRKKKRPHEQQDPFSTSDLKLLFCDSPEYGKDNHKKAHNFWIPLIGLFTGMRLEEICQLYVTDLVKIDGIWCFDIKEEEDKPDKSVKTGEKRLVPLHPRLVNDLNFVKYVKNIPDQKGGRYAKPFKPKQLLERTVLKLDYGIDFSHLKKSKFVQK